MDFRQFRDIAKRAGFAVDQHAYQGAMFVFMTKEWTLAVPAGREQVYLLLEFADKQKFDLRKLISNHHALESELESGATPVFWQEFVVERPAYDLLNEAVFFQQSNERKDTDEAPPGRVYLSDWLE